MAIVTKEYILPDPTETINGFVFPLVRDNFPQDLWDELRSDGQDLLVYADEAKTQRLPLHINFFDATGGGTCQIWVRLATYSTSARSITLESGDAGRTQPAVDAAFGRNEVYQDFAFASHDGRADLTGGTVTTSGVIDGVTGPLGNTTGDFENGKTTKTIASLSSYTLMGWWNNRFDDAQNGYDIINLLTGTGTPESSFLYDNSPDGFGMFNTPDSWLRSTQLKVNNTWESIAAVGSAETSTRKIYYNGGEVASGVLSSESTGRTSLSIGKRRVGWSGKYAMTHIFIRPEAITPTHLSRYYDSTSSPETFAVEVVPAANTAPTLTVSAPISGEIGATITATASGVDAENDSLTYAWRVVSGTATLSSTSTPSVSFTMTDNVVLGVTVSDAEFTSSEEFTKIVVKTVEASQAIPNIVQPTIQGIAVDATGFYFFNSTFNSQTNDIVKRDSANTLIATNTNPFLNLPAGGYKNNDGFVDAGVLYGIPTAGATSCSLVSYDATDLTYLSHVVMPSQANLVGGACKGHNGNVFLVNFVRDNLADDDVRRVVEVTFAGAFVQYHAIDIDIQEMQGIAYDGTFYYITSSAAATDKGTIYKFNTSFELQEVIKIDTTWTEMEGIAFHDDKLYVHDINETPFIFRTLSASNNAPVLAAITTQNVAAGASVTVTASATDADVSDTLTYSFTVVQPIGLTLSGTGASRTFTAPIGASASTVLIDVTANDGTADSNTVRATVNVAAENVDPPATEGGYVKSITRPIVSGIVKSIINA